MDKRTSRVETALRQQSGIALAIACLFAGTPAWAQTAPTAEAAKPAAAPTKEEAAAAAAKKESAAAKKDEAAEAVKPAGATPAVTAELDAVLVIGARASQRSSIARKKNAATAMDSIISEDVGAFPDRNVGEAISRIAGVALDRGDFGEGTTVSVRGTGAELTRVELDGQAVQSGGGTNLLQGGDGRGVELRELSSDLIKSVDVVKGSTADMVEGSLGGGIIITTRNGLDFDKLYYSARVSGTQSSLNKKTTPNLNLVVADKFLDGRLGVLVNLGKSEYSNEVHQQQMGGANGLVGLGRQLDFDNSPEKTFTYNPATLYRTDTLVTDVTKPLGSWATLASGTTPAGVWSSASPEEILTKSAAAQTKAACYSAFPAMTTAEKASINGTTNRNAAINARSNELLSCLNQWNDYAPILMRSYIRGQEDKRSSGDIRLDFKVSDSFSVYGKYSNSTRDVLDTVGNYNFGGGSTINPAGSFVDANGVRSLSPTAVGATLFPTTTTFVSNVGTVQGATSTYKPGYTVDSTHHVTNFTVTDGAYNTDMITSHITTGSTYGQVGGDYKNGNLRATFLLGDAKSKFDRNDLRVNGFGYTYGEGNFAIQPDGTWGFSLPEGSTNDQLNFAKYATLGTKNATTGQAFTSAPALQMIRSMKSESEERTAKADFTYQTTGMVPFLDRIKTGLNIRDTSGTNWGNGGATIQSAVGTTPAITLPSLNVRNTVVGCENLGGTASVPCAYGYNATSSTSGQTVLTQAQYQELIRQTLTIEPNGQFFGGSKDRGVGLINGFNLIDVDKVFSLAGVPLNKDCIVICKGSDGKYYEQPKTQFKERSTAAYFMADFDVDRIPFTDSSLPFGMELQGNAGVRVVKTDVEGVGFMSFRSISRAAGWTPDNPSANIVDVTTSKNTAIKSSTVDVLPSFNLALWAVPSKLVMRYTIAKTVARPPTWRLLPTGTCTVDERLLDAEDVDSDGSSQDARCTTMGNPGLKPQTNKNQNLSAEWYVNKDMMFGLAGFENKGIIGAPTATVGVVNEKVFAGSSVVDPITGRPLSDIEFSYNRYDNQRPSTVRGIEVTMKSAFTFLPSVLRHTGLDFNATKLNTKQSVPVRELMTGDVLPIIGQPDYSYNASLWYDDGGFSARLALQVVAERYSCYSPCNNNSVVNNYPSEGTSRWTVAYNPGTPMFANRTSYIDGKIAYKFKNGFEIFAEGRNLTGEHTQTTAGQYQSYADGVPSLFQDNYTGRRYLVGFNIRSQ